MDDYNDFFSQSPANSTTPKDNDLSKPQSEGTPAPDHSTTPVSFRPIPATTPVPVGPIPATTPLSVGPIPVTIGGQIPATTGGRITTEETDEQISKACVYKCMAWEYLCFGVLMLWL